MLLLLDILFIALAFFLLLLTCTMISHVWVSVPYVPTEERVVRVMVEQAHLQQGNTVYDLGAGDGRTLIAALQKCPGIRAVAIEAIPTVYLWGRMKSRLSKKHIEWRLGSFFKHTVSDANVIFLYLYPALMKKLEQKFNAELQPGTRIVSHAFQFPNRKPIEVVEVPCKKRMRKVYVYEW